MPNVAGKRNVSGTASLPAQQMGAGNFYAIHGAREQCGTIFSDVRHATPRKLPKHSHELAFFALVLNGHYRERCGRFSANHETQLHSSASHQRGCPCALCLLPSL